LSFIVQEKSGKARRVQSGKWKEERGKRKEEKASRSSLKTKLRLFSAKICDPDSFREGR